METIALKQWEDFIPLQKLLIDEAMAKQAEQYPVGVSEPLFRGQGNSDWKLQTTLERTVGKPIGVLEYYKKIKFIHAELESRVNQQWKLPFPDQFREKMVADDGLGIFHRLLDDCDLYPYMVYLRHQGFPSPLLDWTRSPFIAAYFAFENAAHDGSVAIYCYREWAGGSKGGFAGDDRIETLGPHLRTHVRHHTQQAEYSLALAGVGANMLFVDHERPLATSESSDSDYVTKITLPTKERVNALTYLEQHNLNAYTLFGTDDSLVYSLGIKVFTIGSWLKRAKDMRPSSPPASP